MKLILLYDNKYAGWCVFVEEPNACSMKLVAGPFIEKPQVIE